MGYRIQNRRDTAARWAEMNPILLEGEMGIVLDDPNQYKIGDGVHTWNELPLRGFTGTIAQTLGNNENAVASQKVVTEKFAEQDEKLSDIGSEVGMLNSAFNDVELEINTINVESGKDAVLSTRFRTKGFLSAPFTVKMKGGYVINYLYKYNKNGAYVGFDNVNGYDAIEITDDTYIYRASFRKLDNSDITESDLLSPLLFNGKIGMIEDDIQNIANKTALLKNDISSITENVDVPMSMHKEIESAYIDSVGGVAVLEGFYIRLYQVNNIAKVHLQGTGGGSATRYAFYKDENVSKENVVELGAKMSGEEFSEILDVPSNATFLAVTYRPTWIQNVSSVNLQPKQNTKKSIKILCFGNSFTLGSMGYAPFLMKDHFNDEMDITIGIAFISGGTLGATWSGVENQYQKLTEDTAYTYWKYNNNAKAWVSSSTKPSEMFADEDWDIITFQQGSNNAPDYTTYQPYLNDCINLVSKKVSKSVKIAWLIPHADANVYGQGKEINVLEAAKKVMDETVTEVVIPYGTAIANARKTVLNNVGDAGSLLYEGKHLQNGIPMLVSNYCSMIVLLGLLGFDNKSIVGINTIEVTDAWVSSHNIPNASSVGSCVGVSSDNCRIAEKCAIMAVKKPYQITDMSALGIV